MADESAPASDKPADASKDVLKDEAAAKADKPADTPEVPAGAENPDAVKRALDAERSAAKEAKKRAEAAEAKLAEIEEADKSELEKAQGKLSKAEQAAVEANAKLLRYEVAAEKEVPAKLVPLLTASTKEDLETQADLILENAKPANADFDGGPRDPAPEPKSPEQAHNEALLTVLGIKPNN